MKYSINFYRDFRHMEEIDEIIITYKDKNAEVLNFLKTVSENQRVILDITKDDNITIEKNLGIFYAAKKIHKNIAIKMALCHRSAAIDLYEENISFFFDVFVDKWDTLISFIKMNVSDVYIVNELGFELKNVSKVCKDANVNIRVFPNVAQTSSKIDNFDMLKAFFIRPEDIYAYEPYVDVCEFFGPLDRQSVLYEIYKSEKWLGDLQELIIGLNFSIGSRTILPCFGEERVNCGKKCYYGQCIICDKIKTISSQLKEAGVDLVIKKEKGVDNDDDKHEVIKEFNEDEARPVTSDSV